MVLLGPLIVLHYLYWRWRAGPERTTWQYQQAEPRRPTSYYNEISLATEAAEATD